MIGALAAVGLAASGEDGRYVQVGNLRELTGLQPVPALLAAGIHHVQTLDGQPVTQGMVLHRQAAPSPPRWGSGGGGAVGKRCLAAAQAGLGALN